MPGEPGMTGVDIRMLQAFDALYKTRNVTRAAEKLGWSQPTLSIWLGKLRDLHQDQLFVRTGGGMQATPLAETLVEDCGIALAAVSRFMQPLMPFDPALVNRVFRICVTDASHVTLLPPLRRRLLGEAPSCRFDVLRIGTETPGLLMEGEADIAIGMLPELEAGFYQQTLYEQNWVCVMRAAHPLSSDGLSIADYIEAEHISVAAGASQRQLEAELRAAGVDRRIRLELPGFLGLPAMIEQTDYIATVPALIGHHLSEAGRLACHPCPVPLSSFQVKQYWHERFHGDDASKWLRAIVAELFQGALQKHGYLSQVLKGIEPSAPFTTSVNHLI